MTYKQAIVEAMKYLASDERIVFIGQSVRYSGHVMFSTLEDAQVPMSKRIELPVIEDSQLGISIGMSLDGFIPCSIYPRMDFLIIAANQLVNHLDKIAEMSCGEFMPKVVIRTMVGSREPLNPGPQHMQDHTKALKLLCPSIEIIKLRSPESVMDGYNWALNSKRSTILVEYGDLYD